MPNLTLYERSSRPELAATHRSAVTHPLELTGATHPLELTGLSPAMRG